MWKPGWFVFCILMTVIWSLVWPRERAVEAPTLSWAALRWGHALTWGLLSAGALWRWRGTAAGGASTLEALGGMCYLVFLIAMLRPDPAS